VIDLGNEIIAQTILVAIVLIIILTPVVVLGYKISKMLENPYGETDEAN